LVLSGQTGSLINWLKAADALFTALPYTTLFRSTLSSATIGPLVADTWFRAVVQNGTCSSANSSAVKITITAPSVGGSVASAQTICSGQSPADLVLSGQTGSVIKWQEPADPLFTAPTDIASTSLALRTLPTRRSSALTWFRAVVQNGTCSSANSSAVKITITAPSVGGSVASAQTICSGQSPADLVLSGQTGSVIK